MIDGAITQMGNCSECSFCLVGASLSLRGSVGGGFRAGRELIRLVRERTAAAVHLEQHRLGGLPGEPQLAARRVVAESLGCYRWLARIEERVEPDHRQRSDQCARIPSHENGETSEPALACASQQGEASWSIRGEQR